MNYLGVDPIILGTKLKTLYPKIIKILRNSIDKNNEFTVSTKKYQRYKGINIDRVSTAGAQKVGQYNLNSNSTYLNSKADDKYESMNENIKVASLLNNVEDNYEHILDLMLQQDLIEKQC